MTTDPPSNIRLHALALMAARYQQTLEQMRNTPGWDARQKLALQEAINGMARVITFLNRAKVVTIEQSR